MYSRMFMTAVIAGVVSLAWGARSVPVANAQQLPPGGPGGGGAGGNCQCPSGTSLNVASGMCEVAPTCGCKRDSDCLGDQSCCIPGGATVGFCAPHGDWCR